VPAAAILVGSALLAASVSTSGCSGSSAQDVLASEQAASSSGTSGTSGAGTSGTSGAGTSGTGTSGSSGAPADASVDSSTGCPPETEPNNGKDTANALAPTLCGVISPAGESDFLTFQLKASSTSMSLNFTGQVLLQVDVGNQSVTLGGGGNGKVPFVKGQRYVVEVKASRDDSKSVPWRVDLVETP
jgi:hypothetical protein